MYAQINHKVDRTVNNSCNYCVSFWLRSSSLDHSRQMITLMLTEKCLRHFPIKQTIRRTVFQLMYDICLPLFVYMCVIISLGILFSYKWFKNAPHISYLFIVKRLLYAKLNLSKMLIKRMQFEVISMSFSP